MKKFRILFVAALILSVLAISVSAATLTLERTENETSGGFDIAIKANVPENVQVLEATLEFDNSKVTYINSRNYSQVTPEILGAASTYCVKPGSWLGTDIFGDPVTYSYAITKTPEMTVEGTKTSVKFYINIAEADKGKYPNNVDFELARLMFKPVENATVEAGYISVDDVYVGTASVNYGYNYHETASIDQELELVDNSLPEVALTIPVTAGDVVYEQGKDPVTVAETGNYELTITEGLVVVNTLNEAQTVYNVANGAVVENTALKNAALISGKVGVRAHSAPIGLRFESVFTKAAKNLFKKSGYLVTVETEKNGLKGTNYNLTFDLVDSGLAKEGVAFELNEDGTVKTDVFYEDGTISQIVSVVTYGIPLNEVGVTTTIAVRPFYILDGTNTVAYGATVKTSALEVAKAIAIENGDAYKANKEYINSLLEAGGIEVLPGQDVDISDLFK